MPSLLVYVDDNVLTGPHLENINKEMQGLCVRTNIQVYTVQLKNDGQEVGNFI